MVSRLVVLLAVVACAAGLAASANAVVNLTYPYSSYTEAGGKCTSLAGFVDDPARLWAKGGFYVGCDRAMQVISAKATLFRCSTAGTNCSSITSTAWTPVYGTTQLSLTTPAVCGGGNAGWFTRVALYMVRPDGSAYNVTRDSPFGRFSPGAC